MADDELDFALNTNKRSARQGRRAAPPPGPPPPADFDGDEDDENMGLGSKQEGGPVERPNKAVAGWGEEAPRKPRTRQLGEGFEAIEDERLRPSSPDKDDSDSDNDIPVIPELEEQAEEDMSSRVAAAPNVAVNRVATYRELDNDLLRQAAFQVLDNEVDLKLLTKALSPMEELTEEDRPWDWDRLFTEVSSELTTLWEKGMEDGEKEQSEP